MSFKRLKYKRKVAFLVLSLLTPLIFNNIALAAGSYEWSAATGPAINSAFCYGVSVSATGQYMMCTNVDADILTSSDYGATWTDQTSSGANYWYGAAVSSSGQYMAAIVYGGNIYLSNDYGVTWVQQTGANQDWYSISMSSSGQYLAAVNYGGAVYTSNDYGATWAPQSIAGSPALSSVTMSPSGQYLATGASSGNIYTSSNYGASWTDQVSSGSHNWSDLAISSSGQYLAGSIGNGNVYLSNNYGVTWTAQAVGAATDLSQVIMSSNGQTLMASDGNNGGFIYESYDYGQTWTADTSVSDPGGSGWYLIAGSSDLSRVLTQSLNGPIYVGYNSALYVPPPVNTNPATQSQSVTASGNGSAPKSPDTGFGTPESNSLVAISSILSVFIVLTGISYLFLHKVRLATKASK